MFGNLLRRLRPLGPEPVRGPVQRPQEGACGDGGVGGVERPGAQAADDEGADAALVAVAFGDDARAQTRRQRVDFEMRGRALDLVDQAEHVRDRHLAQSRRQRAAIPARRGERTQQPVGGLILAEEEELVLAAEVVIQVGRGKVGRDRDMAHAGGGEAARPEDPRRRAHDVHAPGMGPFRTAVRNLNHGSDCSPGQARGQDPRVKVLRVLGVLEVLRVLDGSWVRAWLRVRNL